jgi:organic hydroperoxide reductase OsmC/OhrA
VTARVGLGPTGNGTFGITVALDVVLPLADQASAERVLERGDAICPYSNAIRGNVEIALSIVGESETAS